MSDPLDFEAICTMSMPTHYTGSVRCGHNHPSEDEAVRCIAALLAPSDPAAPLDAAWRSVEAVLPKSKGTWGYSIHALKYTVRGWCAVAAGARTGEWVEGFGATPVDALLSLAAALAPAPKEAEA